MALYSVWDWNRNSYRVYTTTRPVSVGDDPIPPRPRGTHELGADPDEHIKALPSGVRFIGYSHLPRGEIRRRARGLGDFGDDAGANGASSNRWVMLGIGLAVGAGAMHLWMAKK
jgi:hypothetical protein